jgi:sec-independent protein translocase protein TatB
MFDVGFSEMVVIAVVALIVIGPEKLPKVARTLGHLVGRLQRYVNDVKADINREMELEELRKLKDEFQRSAQGFEQTIHGEVQRTESEMRALADEATPKASDGRETPAPNPAESSAVDPHAAGKAT